MILKQRKAADRTEAINNIKQIGAMLLEFDTEYGNFPDNETAQDVKDATGTDLTFGGTFSNDYFRQMLAGWWWQVREALLVQDRPVPEEG